MMKKSFLTSLLSKCAAAFVAVGFIAGCANTSLNERTDLPAPPVVSAKAYVVLDVDEGKILAQSNARASVEPASLTKLMTAYLVFDALSKGQLTLDQTIVVSERARNVDGSRMFLEQGEKARVEDLIKGMVVQAGNDASTALAEGTAGTVEQFVERMNAQAAALGMQNTVFKNPEGLPADGHITTAYDLAILGSRLIKDFPLQYKYYSIKEFEYRNIRQSNRNRLLFTDQSVDGLQTGRTDSAGYCYVVSALRAVQGKPKRLLVVILGADTEQDRIKSAEILLNWGYSVLAK